MKRPLVLVVAGLDPSGGAGVLADALRVAEAGAHAVAVVSCLTVQDTRGLREVHSVPARTYTRQLDCILSDMDIRVVKTGALPTRAHIVKLVERLPATSVLVADPVFASTGGVPLADRIARAAFVKVLVPRATLLTPNLPELAALTGMPAGTAPARRRAAEKLLALGARAVLVKGGHGRGPFVTDELYTPAGVRSFRRPRLRQGAHGTGCALASLIAGRLACGDPVERAVKFALDRVHAALRNAWKPGKGRPLLGT